jgi:hypothetical protein
MGLLFEHSRVLPTLLTKEMIDAIFKDYGDDALLIINQHPCRDLSIVEIYKENK